MKCPIDTTIDLVMTDRQGIEIDYCPTCRGVWLDRGELDKIIDRASPATAPAAAPVPVAQPVAQPIAPYPAATPYSAAPPADRRPRSWDDDDDDDDRRYRSGEYRPKKRKSILGEIFDF